MEEIKMIKPEYLIANHERVLSLKCVSDSDRTKLESCDSTENENVKTGKETYDDSKKSKKWKVKLKGQNKNRATFRVPDEMQLCSKVLHQGENGELGCTKKGCRFLHSIQKYLEGKDPDLDDSCYLFKTKGKCPWSVTCRYAASHLDDEGKNIENPEIIARHELDESSRSLNKISYETLQSLRKRTYDFSKTAEIIKAVDGVFTKNYQKDSDRTDIPSKRSLDDSESLAENGDEPVKKLKDENGEEARISLSNDERKNSEDIDEEPCAKGIHVFGPFDDSDLIKLRPSEKKKIDWTDQLYLAPLTTLGNLPFRRICKEYGADITCGEMTLASSLLKGDSKEWSLVKRHSSEKIFGIQVAGNNPFLLTRASQALCETCDIDFIDINLGCPIDELYRQGIGSGMLMRPKLLKHTALSLNCLLDIPFTFKVRMGCKRPVVHNYTPWMKESGLSLLTIHGRSREQRYTRSADWNYVEDCAKKMFPVPVFGNGDILSYKDYVNAKNVCPTIKGVMIGRGALMKPWIFQEIKENRDLDPSSSERLDMLKKYVNYGLDHWGSDNRGVENTRRFLLEWLSFLHRYVPTGILTNPPQVMNERPPFYKGRDELETLMASPNAQDWIKISEMLLGPVPEGFLFLPKHKANAWK